MLLRHPLPVPSKNKIRSSIKIELGLTVKVQKLCQVLNCLLLTQLIFNQTFN